MKPNTKKNLDSNENTSSTTTSAVHTRQTRSRAVLAPTPPKFSAPKKTGATVATVATVLAEPSEQRQVKKQKVGYSGITKKKFIT